MAEGDRSEQPTSGRSVRHRVSWASVAATLILLVAVIIFGTIAYEFPPAMVGDVLVVHPLTARRSAGASVAPAESSVLRLAVMGDHPTRLVHAALRLRPGTTRYGPPKWRRRVRDQCLEW